MFDLYLPGGERHDSECVAQCVNNQLSANTITFTLPDLSVLLERLVPLRTHDHTITE